MQKTPSAAPIAAEVRQDTESEAALIASAKHVISTSNWKIGEIATKWTKAYARGRTDSDFGAAIGISGDQVSQCRRVWDRWGGISDTYSNLSWSHFYAALAWDDAETYLEWASDNYASVAEMKAYRTAKTAHEFLPPAGERDGDPFEPEEDPFGEGEEGAGTDSEGDGLEADEEEAGEETGEPDEEHSARPTRNGREASGGTKSPNELFAEQKAKAVKTVEALMRAIDDLKRLRSLPRHDDMIKALMKILADIKSCK